MKKSSHRVATVVFASLLLAAAFCSVALAMDEVTFRADGKERHEAGRTLVTAQDGGFLLQGRDGRLWPIGPDELISKKEDDRPFTPFTKDELARRMLAELPKGFETYSTTHYLICYDTSRGYAQWCGALFERLYGAFNNLWTRKGFELHEPEFPLVAVVFADRESYLAHAKKELGESAGSIIGYFNLMTNRMTMYDLTGLSASGEAIRGSSSAQINQILSQPRSLITTATVVHEATHQIAFNCGLHTRLSDCPVWFSEGIAMYFETPDLRSAKGWAGIGGVNHDRMDRFSQFAAQSRGPNSLKTLIENDKRFHDSKVNIDAYAEAWALTYFLIKQKPKEYTAYLRALSQKKPIVSDTAEGRVAEFEKQFGDLKKLDVEFMRFMGKVR